MMALVLSRTMCVCGHKDRSHGPTCLKCPCPIYRSAAHQLVEWMRVFVEIDTATRKYLDGCSCEGGLVKTTADCAKCGGSGKDGEKKCPLCRGEGTIVTRQQDCEKCGEIRKQLRRLTDRLPEKDDILIPASSEEPSTQPSP
jgi:hypothetical protein